MKKRKKKVVALVLMFVILCTGIQMECGTIVQAENENLFEIMGTSSTCVSQLINYYMSNKHGSYPSFYVNSDAPTIYTFCQIYMEEAKAEGVKPEVAFAQAMKETCFLQYKDCDVSIDQYNFAGIGATGGGVKGNSFPSVRIGIRAQIQHLKAYASTLPLNNDVVDPRFYYVTRESAKYVEWLGIKENPTGHGWASDPNYGHSIVNDYITKLYRSSRFSTWYQGKDYSAVYDPDYYMSVYADVAAACGESSDSLLRHFVNDGMKEGRQAKESFNVYTYKRNYKDLRMAFGNDLKSYYLHYVNSGQKEGRNASSSVSMMDGITIYNGVDYSSVYDYNYYENAYGDIKSTYGDDDIAALAHFVNCGMKEGRQAKDSFNVNTYKRRYKDLRTAYGSDTKSYYLHYMNYGRKEGRDATGTVTTIDGVTVYRGVDYSSVYNYNFYVNNYSDIKSAYGDDDIATLAHFVNYGMQEGRQGNDAFHVKSYKNYYRDLRNAFGDNLKQYYLHYINYGKAEGRVTSGYEDTLVNAITAIDGVDYEAVYDFDYYIQHNNDVLRAYGYDEKRILQHFINYGMSEGRQGKEQFNVRIYQDNNGDLINAYGDNTKQYYLHFMYYGRSEGRKAA